VNAPAGHGVHGDCGEKAVHAQLLELPYAIAEAAVIGEVPA
jgi:hypothetical protein